MLSKADLGLRPTVVFAIFMVITFIGVATIWQIQRGNSIKLDEVAVERWTRLLQSQVYSDIDSISSVANFFHATDKHDWYHFADFSKEMMKGSASLIAVQWMEKVELENLDAHLAEIQQARPFVKLYTATENDIVFKGVVDKSISPIYVATDVYPPTKENLRVLGFYSVKERFIRVKNSIISDRAANISDKVTLLQDDLHNVEPSDGFLVYSPAFYGESDVLKGVVIGVVRASVYFDSLIGNSMNSNAVAVRIKDMGYSSDDDPVLYQSGKWGNKHSYQLSSSIRFPNRTWSLEFQFSRQVSHSDRISLFFIALSGIVISILVSRIVYKTSQQNEILEIELEKRTKELNYLVTHDPNTNALNRRAFNEVYKQLIEAKLPFSLITFDVDNFKTINDLYGHPIGDAALAHIANQVSVSLSEQDKLFRVGGDEFYVITSVSTVSELFTFADLLRTSVCDNPLKVEGDIHVSISLGGAVYKGEEMEPFAQKVDLELYKSKKFGRNRVSILGANDEMS